MNRLTQWLIRGYQQLISPLLGQGKCRYHPTCSQYALQAFGQYLKM